MKSNNWFWISLRILIGLLFTYTGLTKLLEPVENFRGVIAQYQVIPYPMISVVAFVLPWFEFLGGVLMVLGYAPRFTASFIAALSLGFLLVMGSSDIFLTQGNHSCGCFGEGSFIHMTMYQMFAMDFINLLICLRIASFKEHPFSLDQWLRKSSPK